jgi:hypothetical protein
MTRKDPKSDPRFDLLFEFAAQYLKSGVGGVYDFSNDGLAMRAKRSLAMSYGHTPAHLRSAVTWLEKTFLIMAVGPQQYKISPIGIDYIRDPSSRDRRLPHIPEEFGPALLDELEKYNAFSKQLRDEARLEDALDEIVRKNALGTEDGPKTDESADGP